MQFNPSKIAFGRHESFALRFGWLTKGFQAFQERKDIFTDDDAVVELGVGRNMVNSIRHWLRAAQLVTITPDIKTETDLGKALFAKESGWDPYLEDEATIWLIHWLLATNPEHATSWFWFFNKFHKPEFTSEEVATSLIDFAKENIEAKFSAGTVKQDSAVLLRAYVQSRASTKVLAEEALDSPLSLLKLITYSTATKTYQSKREQRENLPLGIFGYAICDLFTKLEKKAIPIEELMYNQINMIAPGLVFRLTETALLTKLEELIQYIPNIFEITDTAGIHQLYFVGKINPFEYLEKHYAS
jgi:hypothetical protein